MNSKLKIVILLILLFTTSCGVKIQEGSTATPTLLIVTATLPPSLIPPPSETPLPPPPTPTTAPVEGIASTQINVRAQPSTAGEVLGIVAANAKIQIIGKDPGGNWWQILYPAGVDGKGWVSAQYVTTAGKPDVPVIGGGGTNQNNGNVAIIQQQLNVRSGPGTDFNSLGTLNPQDVVNLTGKDANGAWLQVEFASGPDGKGWINAAFVQARGVENLPIITEAGIVVGTGTPTGIPPTPSPTVIPAWNDQDSPDQPAAQVSFEATETHTFIYNGDVSAPQGDAEDWIAFTSYSSTVFVSLSCNGSHSLEVKTLENGIPTEIVLACGDQAREVPVEAGSSYLIHIRVSPTLDILEYISYKITISTGI